MKLRSSVAKSLRAVAVRLEGDRPPELVPSEQPDPHVVVVQLLESAVGADAPPAAIRAAYEAVTRDLGDEAVHLALLALVADVATDPRLGRDALPAWLMDRRFALIVDGDARAGGGS